ncbi:MAG: PaaI family thioesterase [Flavobacteriia bacterium]
MKTPQEIVAEMMHLDAFSNWLGIELIYIAKGRCELKMSVKNEMLNGFAILHGGISYSLSDSALAFAANSYGNKCVSIETSISHLKPVGPNEKLKAIATELHRGRSLGVYEVSIFNQLDEKISIFKGTVHISKEIW